MFFHPSQFGAKNYIGFPYTCIGFSFATKQSTEKCKQTHRHTLQCVTMLYIRGCLPL